MSRILIIEDDVLVANIYRNKLSVEGYEVEIARDGQAGLDTIRSFRPDAVLLDLMLPKIPGVELMKTVRADPTFKDLPIIVLSGTYLTHKVQEAWKAGATKCLSKVNCSPNQVLEIMRSVLNQTGTARPSGVPAAPASAVTPAPSAPVAAPAPAHRVAPAQDAARPAFLASLPGTLTNLRLLLQALIKADSDVLRLKQLQELHQQVRPLASAAAAAGLVRIAHMASALEALLKELHEKPRSLNASTLRTVASAVDFLGQLFDLSGQPESQHLPAPSILVVDDEVISRRAITFALDKAKVKSVNMEDPQAAYKLLSENAFDLVFLDVDMPGMTGFELCAKLRKLAAHQKTPVVFVTSLNDLESRAHSTMSGGNDFIAKPFLFIELAVKALVYVLRKR